MDEKVKPLYETVESVMSKMDYLLHENEHLLSLLSEQEARIILDRGFLISCPYCGEQMEKRGVSMQISHIIKCADNRIEEKEAKVKELKEGIEAVIDLINESHGVDGLHLNGDIAPWDELRTGGRFEMWLIKFDNAYKLIKNKE
jgi:hypothetical protein